MKNDKIDKAAEQIVMPEYLKKRIMDRCSTISANADDGDPANDIIQVSGVDRVERHTVRHILTAVAACAVLAAGLGATIHFMPGAPRSDLAVNMSDTEEDTLFGKLLSNDFSIENAEELSAEQRNDIKNIIEEAAIDELTEDNFNYGEDLEADRKILYKLNAVDSTGTYHLIILNNDRVLYITAPIEIVNEKKQVKRKYYSTDTDSLFMQISGVLGKSSQAAVPAIFADIEERDCMEVTYSCSEPIPPDKRHELAELFSSAGFTLEPDCLEIDQCPEYVFTDSLNEYAMPDIDSCIFLYRLGMAEVHEDGETRFYSFDYDTVRNGINDILFPDMICTGKELSFANMLNEDIQYLNCKVNEEFPSSYEANSVLYDYLCKAEFRRIDNNDSINAYRSVTSLNNEKGSLGFTLFGIGHRGSENSWSVRLYDSGYAEVYDKSHTGTELAAYIYDPVGFYSALSKAFPDLAYSYPPFGTIYKSGSCTLNGEQLNEPMSRELSKLFFGLNWKNDKVSDSFRSEEPEYTVETGSIVIHTYKDGTLEYRDGDSKVHTFDDLSFYGNAYISWPESIEMIIHPKNSPAQEE